MLKENVSENKFCLYQSRRRFIRLCLFVWCFFCLWMSVLVVHAETIDGLKAKFPEGKYWNHAGSASNNPDGYTNTPCTHHGNCSKNDTDYSGWCGCNSFGQAIQCFGFVNKLTFDYYGSICTGWRQTRSLDQLKAGDAIRYKNNGHSIWVTAVNGDTITYADCNSDRQCKIMWGKTISKSEVAATLTNVYVAPYAATNASSAPTNPNVSKSAFWYDIKDTISLYIHADGATSYYMSLFKDGQKIVGTDVNSGTYTFAAGTYGEGEYSAYFSCTNSYGTVDSSWIEFAVVGKPGYTGLNKSQEWYDIKDTIEISVDTVCAKGAVIGIDKVDVGRVITEEVKDYKYSIAASALGMGTYYVYFSVYNGSGTVDTEGIMFSVVGGASYSSVKTEKRSYLLEENIKITVDSICAKGAVIGIDKVGAGRMITEQVTDNTYFAAASTLGAGEYSAYFSVYNGSGGCDTEYVSFTIVDKKNLGDEFYAYIEHTDSGTVITQYGDNVEGDAKACGNNQVWHFIRQPDGSYKILSMLDGRAMDVTNYGSSGAGTNVQVYDEWDSTAQRFHLYYLDSAYYVKPICCDMVLDLSAQTNNLQVWGRGDNWNTQKFDIYKIDKNEIGQHSYEQEIIPPTCTANGYTNYVCSECGDAYQGDYTQAREHSFTDWEISKEAACTEDGECIRSCSECGMTETSLVDAMGHQYQDTVVEPTETSQGYTLHTCLVCGDSYQDSFTDWIPEEHQHIFGMWQIVEEASCTVHGMEKRVCSECGKIEHQVIPAAGHRFNSVVFAPSCTEPGYTLHQCEVCGTSYQDTLVAKKDHQQGEWRTSAVPTCTAEGEQVNECVNCGKVLQTRKLLKTAHQWGSGVIQEAPDCIKTGIMQYLCAACGAEKEEAISATGHTWNAVQTVDQEPTCTETGIKSIHCSICNAIKENSEEEIPLAAHTEVKDTAVPPTCTKSGKTEGSHCAICNKVIKEQEEIPVISHDYKFNSLTKATLSANGKIIRKCTGCGKPATQILSYPKTITLSNTKYTYNGKVIKPTVTVKGADGKEIHPANYSVTYSPGCKNAGTYNVIITFKANYIGKVTKSFTINKASQTLSAANHTKVYGNAAFFTGVRQTKGNGKLSFTSSNPKVATVSSTGKITITGIGRTTITITAAATTNYNKATKAITVTVNPKATFISGIKNSDSRKMSISWNKNGTVTGYQVQYATNDSFSGAKTLTISKNSTLSTSVSNLPKGNTYYVRVRTYKKVYSTTYYSSWSAAKSVKITMGNPYLSKTSISLNAGVKYGLKLCDTTQKAVWSSSNSAVAAVSSSGVVTGKKAGTATVTAKIGGKSYTCKVTVKGSINVTVYWTPGGSVYHSTRECPSLARSKTIKSGSVSQSGKSRKCKVCY